MTDTEKLSVLKSDLQLLTSAQDEYLAFLLTAASAAMTREGITDDETADYNACQIDYAAYLYRKRAGNTSSSTIGTGFAPSGGETAMPRFLRYQLNNILMQQKIQTAGATTQAGTITDMIDSRIAETVPDMIDAAFGDDTYLTVQEGEA